MKYSRSTPFVRQLLTAILCIYAFHLYYVFWREHSNHIYLPRHAAFVPPDNPAITPDQKSMNPASNNAQSSLLTGVGDAMQNPYFQRIHRLTQV